MVEPVIPKNIFKNRQLMLFQYFGFFYLPLESTALDFPMNKHRKTFHLIGLGYIEDNTMKSLQTDSRHGQTDGGQQSIRKVQFN